MVARLDMKMALSGREITQPKLTHGFVILPFNNSMERELAEMVFLCYKGHGDLEFLQERTTVEGCLALVRKEIVERKMLAPLIIMQGEKFCGFTWAALHDGKHYVSEVGVVPEFRGKGLGRALLAKIVAEIAALGAKEVYLGVSAPNEDAAHLYKSFGFEVIREWDTKDLKKKK
ncbi:MAG: GNAT family N-acetyltransferase [Candidatus Thermoplasmatota archaeon]|nr:GNAT family N-acetyltransferase [Candidatus Thermoplasmatota archaeon]